MNICPKCKLQRPKEAGDELCLECRAQEVLGARNVWQEVIDLQDACNPSAVVNFFAGVVMPYIRLQPDYIGNGTPALKRHPLFILMVSKLESFTPGGIGSIFACTPAVWEEVSEEAKRRGGKG